VNLPAALRKALAVVRDEKRAAYLQSSSSRYRLIPEQHHRFGVDDSLCDKWSRA